MSKIALKSNPLGTGTFTIESPNSNNDRTVVLPDGNGSVVLTDATQTLTNKSISASQVNSGTLDVARIPDLAASKITSGTLATARLGSGTADSTTFLRGDNTWQTISTTPTTDQVLTATAGASVGAVGTYALLGRVAATTITPGLTLAGSDLRYTGFMAFGTTFTNTTAVISVGVSQNQNTAPAGTWRCMGTQFGGNRENVPNYPACLWLRIS
jgi:hypothetical protein